MSTTPNIGLPLPNFTVTGWHTAINEAFYILDAALKRTTFAVDSATIWRNSTPYSPGDYVVDETTGTYYACLIAHVSSEANTFAQERAAFPTYWASDSIGSITAPVDQLIANFVDVYDSLSLYSEAYQWRVQATEDRLGFWFNNGRLIYFKAGGQIYAKDVIVNDGYFQLARSGQPPIRLRHVYTGTPPRPRLQITDTGSLRAEFDLIEGDSALKIPRLVGLANGPFTISTNDGAQKITLYDETDSVGPRISIRINGESAWSIYNDRIFPAVDGAGSLGVSSRRIKNIYTSGKIVFGNLPTSPPTEVGQLWRDGTTVKVVV